MRRCKVFVHDIEAGTLVEADNGIYTFTYRDGYSGDPVSLSMPVREELYQSDFLSGLWNRDGRKRALLFP